MKIEIVSKFMCKKNDLKNFCSQVIAQNALDQSYRSIFWLATSPEGIEGGNWD